MADNTYGERPQPRLRHNLLAGVANSIFSALVALAIVPFYLKYLGTEAYGLIGFLATIQAVLSILDMGMATTINREVARYQASGRLRDVGTLLHALAVVYWIVAGTIVLLIFLLAPFITDYWLQSKQVSPRTIMHAVTLIGIVVACRWPIALYQGALLGAQRLVVTSTINLAMTTISSVGALGILAYVSPTIEALFVWLGIIGLLHTVTMREAAWRTVGKAKHIRFDLRRLRAVWRFSVGMTAIAFTSVVLMQSDKLLLSKMLSLEDYGRYMLAAALANGLLVILTPVFNVIYPRMTSLVTSGKTEELLTLYRSSTFLLSATLFPIVIVAVLLSRDLLYLWTGNMDLASSVSPIFSLLLIGTALNGVMVIPYALQLAHGLTKMPLTIAVCIIAASIPATLLLANLFGPLGGAMGWALSNSLFLLFGSWFTHRQLLKGIGLVWLVRDVGMPLCLSVILVGIGWKTIHVEGTGSTNILVGGMIAMLTIIAIVLPSRWKTALANLRRYTNTTT